MFHLRPYQTALIDETRSLMKEGVRSILITSPTGSGKTLLTAHMIGTAASKGMVSWFTVHRRELVKQSLAAFRQQGIPCGVIASGFPWNRQLNVQVASIQTLARRFQRYAPPNLIVWDEAHHSPSRSWDTIHKQFPSAFHVGLTATPQRLDGKGLSAHFAKLIIGPSVQSLIEQAYLCPYKIYAPSTISTQDIRIQMGDFKKDELSKAADKPTITGDAIAHYKTLCPGKRAVVFCCSIQHSKHVVEQFLGSGISAAHVDGETPMWERDRAIEKFRAGEILVLSNVDLFGEGFDVQAIEAVILLRPTASLGLYLQMVGRSLRTYPGKTQAIILDHSGNCLRHGLPDDDREWSLEGTPKKKKGEETSVFVRTCPACFAVQRPGSPTCKFCGFAFIVQPREVEQKDGQLVELDPAAIRRNRLREQGICKTFKELVDLGVKRGYKNPRGWAFAIEAARRKNAESKIRALASS